MTLKKTNPESSFRKSKQRKLRRLANTKRVISKRLRIIREEWCLRIQGLEKEHPWLRQTNRVNKYNLRCGCRTCRIRDKHPRRDKIKNNYD